jgi:hypothetical protein
VNAARDSFEERENLCPAPEDAYRLCDLDWVDAAFRDDPILAMILAEETDSPADQDVPLPVPVTFGLPDNPVTGRRPGPSVRRAHIRDSLYATRRVLELVEQFVRETGKQLLVMLSYTGENVAAALRGEPRYDRVLTDWLKTRPYPVVDMRDAFLEDFSRSTLDVDAYLDRYYIGHHNPAGNFFTAQALRKPVVEWLDPKPSPYRRLPVAEHRHTGAGS